MEWYANAISYPINIGGRPIHSWPAFIPITFELTVLCAGLTAFFGSLALNGLPRPYHPLFHIPEFDRASQDRFLSMHRSKGPKVSPQRNASFFGKPRAAFDQGGARMTRDETGRARPPGAPRPSTTQKATA